MEISTTRTEHPVDDARLAEILANPGFGTHFTDHMFTVEWTPAEGWHEARDHAVRPADPRPGHRGPALRAGDLRGHEGLPARGRLDLGVPAGGERRADGALHPPAGAAAARRRRLRAGRRGAGHGRPALGARPGGREEPLRPAVHVRLRGVPRRPARPARDVHGDRQPGRLLLQGRHQAGQPLAVRGLHPRRPRRHGRGQDRRQLRQLAARRSRRPSGRAATRWSSSTARRGSTSRSSAA